MLVQEKFPHSCSLTLVLQVLCPSAPPCCQLPQEEVWTHKQPSPQEEAEVDILTEAAVSAILR